MLKRNLLYIGIPILVYIYTRYCKCVIVPVAFSVILLQLVQAVKVKLRSRVQQTIQRVRLKAITESGGA